MKAVFFDIDTQLDFLYPAGALYVPGGESIVPAAAALNRHAAARAIPVISTMDAHTEDDVEFRTWPHHCVAGTHGQQKPSATLLERRVVVPNVLRSVDVAGAQQVLLEKQTVDCFDCVNLHDVLAKLGAERCVVYGVVTEICVKLAAMGLLKTGRRVEIVTDAVRALSAEEGARTLAEFTAAGGVLVAAAGVLA
jgi:nicotinamidase/pyrazinamidase